MCKIGAAFIVLFCCLSIVGAFMRDPVFSGMTALGAIVVVAVELIIHRNERAR